MKNRHLLLLILPILFLSACGIALPEKYKSLVGKWSNNEMTIIVHEDGEFQTLQVVSNLDNTHSGEPIDGPLQEIDDNHFVIGPGSFTKEFKIDRLPYEEDGKWYWEVDGKKLLKLED